MVGKWTNKAMQKTLLMFIFVVLETFAFSAWAQESISPSIRNFWKMYFQGYSLPQPAFKLKYPGASIFLDYSKYGEFVNAGKEGFRYVINNAKELKDMLGEGIYPNLDVYNDPDYKKLSTQGLLKGSSWDLLRSKEFQRAFFVWTQAPEDPGVKMFFTAKVLENAGLIEQAVKAYYATVIFYPKSAAWAADHSFVWYIAPAAISSVKRLCRDYPDLNCSLTGASFDIQNGEDVDLSNDIIICDPGKIVHTTVRQKVMEMPNLGAMQIISTRGTGKVQVVKYANGHWQMLVDGKPYYIKGITYAPTEVGLGYIKDPNFADRWMFTDKNNNGIIDASYEAWIDDSQKPIGDFQLLKEMGINTIRLFAPNRPINIYDSGLINKALLRDMYKRFGIMATIGDYLGAYTLGSGSTWEKGTDYTDPQQCARMKEVVRAKVMDLKDEPFVLMWVLGNENNLPANYLGVNATRTNAAAQPRAYAQFVNEVAEMIHEIDGNHPVAIGNLELGLLDYYKQYAPAIDILGINSYRGIEGFGSLFIDVQKKFDRPVVITEYGCDAYTENSGSDEDRQLAYLRGNFRDLVYNKPGGPGVGNAIGGFIFEYLDEWWKAPQNPDDQQTTAYQQVGQSPDGYIHEEWFGLAGQGDGKNSPVERHLRKAYFYFKNILNKVPN